MTYKKKERTNETNNYLRTDRTKEIQKDIMNDRNK